VRYEITSGRSSTGTSHKLRSATTIATGATANMPTLRSVGNRSPGASAKPSIRVCISESAADRITVLTTKYAAAAQIAATISRPV